MRLSDAEILRMAIRFDQIILRLKTSGSFEGRPYLNRWPKCCCDSPYVFLFLYGVGCRGIQKVRAEVSGVLSIKGKLIDDERHVWSVVNDGLIVDLTAHQFDGVDSPIVSRVSKWHAELTVVSTGPWITGKSELDHVREIWEDGGDVWNTLGIISEELGCLEY